MVPTGEMIFSHRSHSVRDDREPSHCKEQTSGLKWVLVKRSCTAQEKHQDTQSAQLAFGAERLRSMISNSNPIVSTPGSSL